MSHTTRTHPLDAHPEQRLTTRPTIASNTTSPADAPRQSPPGNTTRDRLITGLAKIAVLYDDITEELSRHELTARDADLIAIPRAHIQLSTDNLDSQVLEVEQHGHSYPMGRPLIPTASQHQSVAINRIRPKR